jgi:hypothetical protein
MRLNPMFFLMFHPFLFTKELFTTITVEGFGYYEMKNGSLKPVALLMTYY